MGVFETLGMIFGGVILVKSLFLLFPRLFKKILKNFFLKQRNDITFFVLMFLSLLVLYLILKAVPMLYVVVIAFSVMALFFSLIFLFMPNMKDTIVEAVIQEDNFHIRMVGLFVFLFGLAIIFLSMVYAQ